MKLVVQSISLVSQHCLASFWRQTIIKFLRDLYVSCRRLLCNLLQQLNLLLLMKQLSCTASTRELQWIFSEWIMDLITLSLPCLCHSSAISAMPMPCHACPMPSHAMPCQRGCSGTSAFLHTAAKLRSAASWIPGCQ